MVVKTLLLWDIDGTLLTTGGAGMDALSTAVGTVFGIGKPIDDIDFAGRTDRWIMRRIFEKFHRQNAPCAHCPGFVPCSNPRAPAATPHSAC